jgi:hypothetical protein
LGTVYDPITIQQAANIYIDSHDPTNNTRYYRWDFLETYKHFSTLSTNWADSDGMLYPLPVLAAVFLSGNSHSLRRDMSTG